MTIPFISLYLVGFTFFDVAFCESESFIKSNDDGGVFCSIFIIIIIFV